MKILTINQVFLIIVIYSLITNVIYSILLRKCIKPFLFTNIIFKHKQNKIPTSVYKPINITGNRCCYIMYKLTKLKSDNIYDDI